MNPSLEKRVRTLEAQVKSLPASKEIVVIQGRLVRIERKLEELLRIFRDSKEGKDGPDIDTNR